MFNNKRRAKPEQKAILLTDAKSCHKRGWTGKQFLPDAEMNEYGKTNGIKIGKIGILHFCLIFT